MNRSATLALIVAALSCGPALADNQTTDAAIGGAIGGATGAVIGSQVGGREGAIVGGAIGAATGTAIATDGGEPRHEHVHEVEHVEKVEHVEVIEHHRHHHGGFCPPGLARQGRC